jgi:hypothetical protein
MSLFEFDEHTGFTQKRESEVVFLSPAYIRRVTGGTGHATRVELLRLQSYAIFSGTELFLKKDSPP